LINDWKAGVLITDFTEEEFAKAASDIEAMVRLPDARDKARSVAQQVFHLEAVGGERYASLYERVLNS
jgi:hypothetical protein